MQPALRIARLRKEGACFGDIAKFRAMLDRDRFEAKPDDVVHRVALFSLRTSQ
jgi:hypothetical protein